MKNYEMDNICLSNACPEDLEIPEGKAVALEKLEEKERLSIAMASYYLMYR